MNKKKKVPKISIMFNPITEGIPAFEVHETLYTLVHENSLKLLIEDHVYRDRKNGKQYTLCADDVHKLIEILNPFVDECLMWANDELKLYKERQLSCYVAIHSIIIGTIAGSFVRHGLFKDAIIIFIIGLILSLPIVAKFPNKN